MGSLLILLRRRERGSTRWYNNRRSRHAWWVAWWACEPCYSLVAASRTISYSARKVRTTLRLLAAMGEDCVKYWSISKSLQVARNGESSCEPRTIFNNSCDESALLHAGWLAKGDKAYAFPNALLCRPGDRRQHIVAIGNMTKARITLLMSSREAVERPGIRYKAVRNA